MVFMLFHLPDFHVCLSLFFVQFRLDDMIREEKEKLQLTISRVPMEAALINRIVRDYLQHYGFHKVRVVSVCVCFVCVYMGTLKSDDCVR
jgi:hypothetical protein